MTRTCIMPVCLLAAVNCLAQLSPLDNLAKPWHGRGMRETSTFRQGRDGKYDRNAPPKGDLEERSNSDNFRVAPGATHVLMDRQGPGVITHIWMTFLGPERQDWAPNGSATHQDMLLRIYWDGERTPSVEAPIGDFFANCFGKRSSVISVPVVVEDADSYNCYWRMPFHKSARIEIVNQGDKPVNLLYYNIDWIKLDTLAKDAPYFHAQYRQEYPAQHGKDYVILDTKGKGQYVGTVMAVRTRSPMWFGEGDEKIYVDGEDNASIWGTGTEDYFGSAWGLQKTSTPYFGTPYFDQWGIVGGHTSAYRWHVNDPIVFQKSLKVTIEHFGWISPDENKEGKTNSWNEREDDYSSVAFWYQTGPSSFSGLAPSGAERRLPSLERVIAYARDGNEHGDGEVSAQQLDLYDGPQVLYMPKPSGGDHSKVWLSIPFEVKKKEPLRLLLNVTKSYDFGTYQAYLEGPQDPLSILPMPRAAKWGGGGGRGIALGSRIDLYSKDIASEEVHLLDFWPDPGKYTLVLVCTGKNQASAGYYLGIESVRLRERRPRVFDWGFDKEKDWRKNPTLYR